MTSGSDPFSAPPLSKPAVQNLTKPGMSQPAQKTTPAISNSSRLASVLKIFDHDDRVLIVISADPDAIASAAALKRILWHQVGHQIVIATTTEVKRPDNLRLLKALKLHIPPLSSLTLKNFTKLAMVDSQPGHSPQTSSLAFHLIIDHHPPPPSTQEAAAEPHPQYVDIRPDWGAMASIIVGYLKAAKIRPNQTLATALFYAIKTDTQNFVRQGQLEDMRAFQWLYPFIHPHLLSEIERAPIDHSSFPYLLAGLNQASFRKNQAYTFLEKVDHADTLVILADFLMQIDGVNRVVAAGVLPEKVVVIFRAGGLRQNMGRLAAKAFGALGSAGGHKNMARAEVPLKNLDTRLQAKPAHISRFIVRHLQEAAKLLIAPIPRPPKKRPAGLPPAG